MTAGLSDGMDPSEDTATSVLGILFALATSVSWALANVFIQRAGRAVGAVRALLWTQIMGGAAALLLAAAIEPAPSADLRGLLPWAAVAGVSALVAYAAMFYAFARAPLSVAVPVM